MSSPRRIRFLPVAVALGLAALLAVAAAVLVLRDRSPADPQPGPLEPLAIAGVARELPGVLRAVSVEDGCRIPVAIRLRRVGAVLELQVLGRDPGTGGCTDEVKVRCSAVVVPESLAAFPLRGVPAAAQRLSAKAVVVRPDCAELPLSAA
jgi:hypothetical protein